MGGVPVWMRQRERSHTLWLRVMVLLSLGLGRTLSRGVLHGIALYFSLFAPKARRASRLYLSRALQRPVTWFDTYRHMLFFASTVHDRVYLLNNRFDLFDIQVSGVDELLDALRSQQGVLMIGAHLGSFEVIRAIGREHGQMRVAMLMFEENARKINATLEAINPEAAQDVIPLGQPTTMLQARDKLEQGYLVGMLADRTLGGDTLGNHVFLGHPAGFPEGPFRVAAMLQRPVFFMTGLYLGENRYHIHFEPLASFVAVDRSTRVETMRRAQRDYVEKLNRFCRQAPYNWFNFFDVWHPK